MFVVQAVTEAGDVRYLSGWPSGPAGVLGPVNPHLEAINLDRAARWEAGEAERAAETWRLMRPKWAIRTVTAGLATPTRPQWNVWASDPKEKRESPGAYMVRAYLVEAGSAVEAGERARAVGLDVSSVNVAQRGLGVPLPAPFSPDDLTPLDVLRLAAEATFEPGTGEESGDRIANVAVPTEHGEVWLRLTLLDDGTVCVTNGRVADWQVDLQEEEPKGRLVLSRSL